MNILSQRAGGKRIKKCGIIAVAAISGIIIVSIVLQSSPVKKVLTVSLEYVMHRWTGLHYSFSAITGFIPFTLSVDSCIVRDSARTCLYIRHLKIHWDAFSLLKSRYHFYNCNADSVFLYHAPEKKGKKSGLPNTVFSFLARIPPISCDTVRIDYMYLDSSLTGTTSIFSIASAVSYTRLSDAVEAHVFLRSIQGSASQAACHVVIKRHNPALTLDLSLHEDQYGLLTYALGLKAIAPVDAVIKGEGYLHDWKGIMRVCTGMGKVYADLFLKVNEDINLRCAVQAVLDSGYRLRSDIKTLPDSFSLNSGITIDKKRKVIIDSVSILNPNFMCSGRGSVITTGDQAVEGSVTLQVKDISCFERFVKKPLKGLVNATAAVKGTIRRPECILSFSSSDAVYDAVRAAKITGNIICRKQPEPSMIREYTVQSYGTILDLKSGKDDTFPVRKLSWDLIANGGHGEAVIDSLLLSGDGILLNCRGILRNGFHEIHAQAHCTARLQPFVPFIDSSIHGSGSAELTCDGNIDKKEFTVNIHGSIQSLTGLPAMITPVVHEGIGFRTTMHISGGTAVEMQSLTVSNQHATITASGSYDVSQKHGAVSFTAHVWDPEIAFDKKILLQDTVFANGTVQADTAGLRLNTVLKTQKMQLLQQCIDRTVITASCAISKAYTSGNANIAWMQKGRQYTLASPLLLKHDTLSLAHIVLRSNNDSIKGSCVFDFHDNLISGALQGRSIACAALSPFIPDTLYGACDVSVAAISHDAKQLVHGSCALYGVRYKNLAIDTLICKGSVDDVYGTMSHASQISLTGGSAALSTIQSLTITAEGDKNQINYSVNTSGTIRGPYAIKANGTIRSDDSAFSISINAMQGNYGENKIVLKKPSSVYTIKNNTVVLDTTILLFGDGKCKLYGFLTDNRIAAGFSCNNMVLSRVPGIEPYFASGIANGSLLIAGAPSAPRISVIFSVDSIRVLLSKNRRAFFSAQLGAQYRDTALSGTCIISGFTETALKATYTLPVEISCKPLVFSLVKSGSMAAALEGDLDVSALNSLFFVQTTAQELWGKTAVSVTASGSLINPLFYGTCTLDTGGYANRVSGTTVDNVTAQFTFHDKRVSIRSMYGTDGKRGKTTVTGHMDIIPSKSFPYAVQGEFSDFTAIKTANLNLDITGTLTFSGTMESAFLKGKVLAVNTLIDLEPVSSGSVPVLEVIEINNPDRLVDTQRQTMKLAAFKKTPASFRLFVDNAVEAKNRFYVRGMGIESEWQGALFLSGDVNQIEAQGGFSVIRGTFDFVDRRFTIKEGTVSFNASDLLNPQVNALSTCAVDKKTISLRVAGPVSAPAVEYSSEPPMPRDEILSALLFNRQLNTLSPVQAYRLATMTKYFSNSRTLFSFIDKTRRLLPVDYIEVKESDVNKNATALSVGTYLGKKIYIQAEQELQENSSSKVSVTWEVTPSIAIEGSAGTQTSDEIGLMWKRDY